MFANKSVFLHDYISKLKKHFKGFFFFFFGHLPPTTNNLMTIAKRNVSILHFKANNSNELNNIWISTPFGFTSLSKPTSHSRYWFVIMSNSFALVIRPNMVKNNGKHKNYWQSMKWAMHPKGPCFFNFWGKGGCWFFWILIVFNVFHQILNTFLNMFPTTHYIPFFCPKILFLYLYK